MKKEEGKTEERSLGEATTHVLEECRMVLPGVQALFGFQLIVVFNETFQTKLTALERDLHLVAIGLVVLSIALVMAPAAYHRQHDPERVSEGFILVATRLLLFSMFPLMAALGLEFWLIAKVITNSVVFSLALSLVLVAIVSTLWFALPRSKTIQRLFRTGGVDG